MSQANKADELLSRLGATNPVPDLETLLTPDQSEALRTRAIAIAAQRPPSRFLAMRRRRIGLRLAAATAAVAAIGILAMVGLGSPGQSGLNFTAHAVEVAEANPRLLITEPGWSVVWIDWTDPENGEIAFSDGDPFAGDHVAELRWNRADEYRYFFRDREDGAKVEQVEVLGQNATLFTDGDIRTTIFPPDGSLFLEFRADYLSRRDYIDLLHSLRATDVETWLSAMPASVVRPDDRSAIVDELLADIPLPPGFDVERLKAETTADVSDRYQLGADVTGAVTCAWIYRWMTAKSAGDTPTMREAIDALSTARNWRILNEMSSQGGWSVEVWKYADLLRDGVVDKNMYEQQMNCIEYPWVEG